MNTNKMPTLAVSFVLLIAINISGALLLNMTLTKAGQTERDLAAQGEQISRSIAIRWQDQLNQPTERLHQLTRLLLTIDIINATLFIDAQGQVIARSGASIPLSLIETFKRTETYGVRQNNLYYLSLPLMATNYTPGTLTEAAPPQGYIVLGLDTSRADQQHDLLLNYFIGGAILLSIINLIFVITVISYFRRLHAYRNAPPEIQQQFAKGYRQLKRSIEMQQRAIDQARREALKTSEIKSQFIANMSHEIRTPLNAIIGFTDLLLKSQLDARQQDFLLTIRKSSLGLLQIINDILDFSKIEAGKVALDEIALDLRETIEDVLTVLAPSAHEKQLELISIYTPNLPNQLLADPLRLKQILTNLVSNSIKFTDKGSIVVRLSLEEKKGDNATFKVSVADTGPGISKDNQQKLFQLFSQADASTTRQFGGSGLGLVIAKQLAEQMNGAIGVSSQPRYGANFWFTFQAKLIQNPLKSEAFNALIGRRIILCDHHPLVRMSLMQLLKEWQTIPRSTRNLEEMEEQVRQASLTDPFDVAIISSDSCLQNGNSLLPLLKKLKTQFRCPTLLLNYTVEESDDPTDMIESASLMLSKPVRYKDIYQSLVQMLGLPSQRASQLESNKKATIQFDRPPKVLVVDDNQANLKLISIMLGEIGAIVTEANSGKQALKKLKISAFDIIFMDIQMPGMDGVEATRLIRTNPSAYRDLPIVALTAHALASERDALLSHGMDDYLSKPITEQQLVDTILEWTDIKLITTFTPKAEAPPRRIKPSATQAFELPLSSVEENTPAIVDIPLAIKHAAGKEELAKELFAMLLKTLDDDYSAIEQAHQKGDNEKLLHQVHRLHGATRYCGVPALTAAAEKTEVALKLKQQNQIDQLTESLKFEIEQVKLWGKVNRWADVEN